MKSTGVGLKDASALLAALACLIQLAGKGIEANAAGSLAMCQGSTLIRLVME